MKPELKPWLPRLTLCALALLLTGCPASLPPTSPEPVQPARIPPLPPEARVSLVPIPSICLPSCTAGVTALREKSADLLMRSELPASPASAPTTDYSPPVPQLIPKR